MRFEHIRLLAKPEASFLVSQGPGTTCSHFNVILTQE